MTTNDNDDRRVIDMTEHDAAAQEELKRFFPKIPQWKMQIVADFDAFSQIVAAGGFGEKASYAIPDLVYDAIERAPALAEAVEAGRDRIWVQPTEMGQACRLARQIEPNTWPWDAGPYVRMWLAQTIEEGFGRLVIATDPKTLATFPEWARTPQDANIMNTAGRKITADEFLLWASAQDARYELVDGEIVAKAPGGQDHSLIAANIAAELHTRLRETKFRTLAGHLHVQISATTIFMPDAGVDCGPYQGSSFIASAPALVVEVLSPADTDMIRKLEAYKTIPSLDYILLVESERPAIDLHRRISADLWAAERYIGKTAVILDGLGIDLNLADIYADVLSNDERF
ncbi:MAG: Uma2 family endonuclease [Rhodospirillales bacterium]|jgi:Uma2 family endonuclease